MFLDTSGLLCFHHRGEAQHQEAVRCFSQATLRVTHSYVLAEFIALAQARRLPARRLFRLSWTWRPARLWNSRT
jgi:predicted nucleic acid-binding protein